MGINHLVETTIECDQCEENEVIISRTIDNNELVSESLEDIRVDNPDWEIVDFMECLCKDCKQKL